MVETTSAPLPVICLAGPTGSGKTAAALAMAAALDGEVVNADSRQVYADFPLITAQPSAEERACCPHHLYGFLATENKISAGRWAEAAVDKVRDILARGKTPLLVGGTGLYFQALLRGMAEIPPVDPQLTAAITARVDAQGAPALHAELAQIDPAYAAKIHPNDRQRIIRALEVCQSTGRSFTWWHSNSMSTPLCVGPLLTLDATLTWLEPRLARRLDLMLAGARLTRPARPCVIAPTPPRRAGRALAAPKRWRTCRAVFLLRTAVPSGCATRGPTPSGNLRGFAPGPRPNGCPRTIPPQW